ncbi:MAG TPA: hypothetical protein PKJ94_08700 [Ferruginibacter sp.]|nr:hypothetical protein [Ferruginibacter sp.]
MPTAKKIFFSYSNHSDDLELYDKINKHFTAYSKYGLLAIVDKNEIFRSSGDNADIKEIQNTTDITIPLLSVDYVNDEECIKQLDNAASSDKMIIPVLLRDFDWEAFQKINQYRKTMLPDDLTSVENHITTDQNDDTIFKEIAQRVKGIVLPEIGEISIQHSTGIFYYIIASIVLVIGLLGSWFIYDQYNDYRISIAAFLMSAIIAMLALKNVLFPNKVRIKR